jgi:hypothetical protein
MKEEGGRKDNEDAKTDVRRRKIKEGRREGRKYDEGR